MRLRGLSVAILSLAGVALAAGAAIVACTSGRSNKYIDYTDTPAGGALVNPGVLGCGASGQCDTTIGSPGCCDGTGLPDGGICLLDAGATCPAGSGLITCNESADCNTQPNGTIQACCATFQADGGFLASQCQPSCPAPAMQLCRTNGECPGDVCVIQRCPDGQTHEMCALSSTPGFQCTPAGG